MRGFTVGVALFALAVTLPALAGPWNEPDWALWPVGTGDPPGLLDPHVLSLAEDRDGGIWIGTLAGGVSRLDPADGTWITHATERVAEGGAVMAIHEARDGTMWFAQEDGIAHIDRITGEWIPAGLENHDPSWHRGAMWIHEDSQGWLWFVDFVDEVSVFDPARGEWHVPPKGEAGVPYFSGAVAEDGAGQVWIGGDSGAVTSPAGRAEFVERIPWEVDKIHVGRSGWI